MKSKIYYILVAVFSLALFVACSKDDDEGEPANNAEYEFTDTSISGRSFYETYEELRMRMLFGLFNPDADYNDPERIGELIEKLANSQAQTRGPLAMVKSGIDFTLAMKNTGILGRCTVLGVIKKAHINIASPKVRRAFFNALSPERQANMKQKGIYDADTFWSEFTTGKLDIDSGRIFDDFYHDSGASPYLEAFGEYCEQNNINPTRLKLTAARPLLEAGFNVIVANSGDLLQYGQTAFDFVNNNGEMLLSFAQGNLDGEKMTKACATNFKILTDQLKGTLEDFYDPNLLDVEKDFLDILTDWTTEQVIELNKEVDRIIKENLEYDTTIGSWDLKTFADRIKEIAKMDMPIELRIIGDWKMDITSSGYAAVSFYRDKTGWMRERDFDTEELTKIDFTWHMKNGRFYFDSMDGKSVEKFIKDLIDDDDDDDFDYVMPMTRGFGDDMTDNLGDLLDKLDELGDTLAKVLKKGFAVTYEDGYLKFASDDFGSVIAFTKRGK